ncbi:MAG: hypothetical protein ACLP8S_20115 [Solirubrobacteraceae bacterium]
MAHEVRAACLAAGVTNAQVLRACELDVGATGYKVFAAGDGQLQKAAGLPASPTVTTPTTPSNLHPIDLAPLTSSVSAPVLAYDRVSQDTYVAWTEAGDTSIAVCVVTTAAPDATAAPGPITSPTRPRARGAVVRSTQIHRS